MKKEQSASAKDKPPLLGHSGDPGWQDISTAPKDGTPVLAYDDGAIFITSYVEADGEYAAGWYDGGIVDPPPTHWMPLPPAPSSPTGQEQP